MPLEPARFLLVSPDEGVLPPVLTAAATAQVAKKCHFPIDTSNCTIGAKFPHYWLQKERNNNFQDYYDPPFYNAEYGFMNGAQTDLFANAAPIDEPVSTAVSSTITPASTSSTLSTASAVASITSIASSAPPTTSEAADVTVTAYTTVYKSASRSASVASTSTLNVSSALPTGAQNVSNTTALNSTMFTVATSATAANSAQPTGKTCRRLSRRGYLVRRIRKTPRVTKEKRMLARPAVNPELRIGTVADPAIVEPTRDFDPVSRRAIEAAGLDAMHHARGLRVSQLRRGRSVRF